MSKYDHRNQGWFESIVTKLGGEDAAEQFLNDEIKIVRRVKNGEVDCDADPSISDSFALVEHRKGGILKLDYDKIDLYYSANQYRGINGYELYRELVGKPVFNGNVLDYLLLNTHLIPGSWKVERYSLGRKNIHIIFWGTIFRSSYGDEVDLCVRSLYWHRDEGWKTCFHSLRHSFDNSSPAALLKA